MVIFMLLKYYDMCSIKGAIPFYNANAFGRGTGSILVTNVYCSSQKSSLLECDFRYNSIHSASHYNDAGVRCQGKY